MIQWRLPRVWWSYRVEEVWVSGMTSSLCCFRNHLKMHLKATSYVSWFSGWLLPFPLPVLLGFIHMAALGQGVGWPGGSEMASPCLPKEPPLISSTRPLLHWWALPGGPTFQEGKRTETQPQEAHSLSRATAHVSKQVTGARG